MNAQPVRGSFHMAVIVLATYEVDGISIDQGDIARKVPTLRNVTVVAIMRNGSKKTTNHSTLALVTKASMTQSTQ